MADITEIIEESAVQLEIVESGGGQIEVISEDSTIIEVIETTLESNDLDIATQVNTIVIESSTPNATIDISTQDPTTVETTITNNVIEITENQVLNVATQSVSLIQDWDGTFIGHARITGSLTISGSDTLTNIGPFLNKGNFTDTIFTDVLSASIAQFTGDGTNNILIIKSGSSFPITVNHDGLIIFDEFTYTPTPVLGGLLYSGSDFYFGLE